MDPDTDVDYSSLRHPDELSWKDRQLWLADKGYMLRPWYRPGWVPSWLPGDCFPYFGYEGALWTHRSGVIDASRVSDNLLVLLKHVKDSVHPHEVGIGLDFSSESLASHPKNHHVPIYEILDVPDDDGKIIIVMPLLRKFKNSRIKSVGEAAEFFRRVFEVQNNIHIRGIMSAAHGKCRLGWGPSSKKLSPTPQAYWGLSPHPQALFSIYRRSTNSVHVPLNSEPEDNDLGGLHPGEVFWWDHQGWLFEKGYMLRPRHRPGWVPSWLPGSGSPYFRYKDGVFNMDAKVMSNVTRVSDNSLVILKRVNHKMHPHEAEIGLHFSQSPLL